MVQLALFSTVLVAALASVGTAHPGHNVQEEALERREFLKNNVRSIDTCASHLNTRGHAQRSLERRQKLAEELRRKRAIASLPYLKARDVDTVLNTSHLSNVTGYLTSDGQIDESVLFSDNTSCVLQPDVTQGPYYVSGELIRRNITEGIGGVPLTIDIQLVDTSTCEPVPNIYLDFWHCNATGVYSGIVESGNGNSGDSANINSTFLRGIQESDSDGVVQFDSIMPGHYLSRTNHIHILAHSPNASTVYPNNTLGTNQLTATHVGQLFFDQDLITQFEAAEPYATNTQEVTENADDSILAEEADTSDPIVEYVLLGDSIEDGVLAWITIGINVTETSTVNAAAYYGENGGVADE
ncbi:putative extracellular dioxygenase [Phaeomoniella chlamydospora]|uniref:Putative extracellular dioxygenase n=1 Tax=Phaeomoniella chlamydospora TaxID=158046 RepID=A0A0G2EIE2_PHACM|nr:putative extracellular dioxygenase [Phaeomoniella chlamydospora]